jgi:hypothetical protein
VRDAAKLDISYSREQIVVVRSIVASLVTRNLEREMLEGMKRDVREM